MNIIFLILAIFFLFLGHFFKVKRWEQFVKIYEKPNTNNLLRALSIGYIINFFVPFHIGDIFRAIFSGKKMKNGISFSLATVVVDRYLDILVVGFLFLLFYLLGINSVIISLKFYFFLAIFLIILAVVSIKYSKYPKLIIKKISSIFNFNIQLKILNIFWCFITSFRDMYTKLNLKKLLYNTFTVWSLYSLSYYLISLYLTKNGNNINFFEIFNLLFSESNLNSATRNLQHVSDLPQEFILVTSIYLVTPLLILLIVSFFLKKFKKQYLIDNEKYFRLIPQINSADKLKFLELYFSAQNRDFFKDYLKINGDIAILENYSAGSNATTMLCSDDSKPFFRKYAFENDGKKLYKQVEWIKKYEKKIPLTKILKEVHNDKYCYYDMEYNQNALGFFKYIHSNSTSKNWSLLKNVLDDLEKKLYTINVSKADNETIEKYIEEKVVKNYEKIVNSKEIKKLSKYDTLIINGASYKNIHMFLDELSFKNLYEIFKNDVYSELHGDMTIENIISVKKSGFKDSYYIIDPNTGNIHDSANLDYAKLLQSLHGGYEFLMNIKNVETRDNEIYYLNTKSIAYEELYKKYKQYLDENFSEEKVKSIFYHEIIHWLRLMPYKIDKDESRALLFYAGLIIVLNEVSDLYAKK